MPVDPKAYRNTIGAFATGVVVITTGTEDENYGVTVNSITSVSLDPTLLLICLDLTSLTRNAILRTNHFNVNILSHDQEQIARFFASKQIDQTWFEDLHCTKDRLGSPVIPGCLAYVECVVTDCHEAGDHTIVLGRVEEARLTDEVRPLVFYRGAFGAGQLPQIQAPAAG